MAKFILYRDGMKNFSVNVEQIVYIEDVTEKKDGNQFYDDCIFHMSNGKQLRCTGSGELVRSLVDKLFIGYL